MKTALYLLALLGFVQAGAAQPSTISGYVRLADGQPVAGARVALFDVTDLAAGAVTHATTDEAGSFALSLQGPGRARPAGFALGPNYPNPFNPSTILPYQLPVSTPVRLEVFNLLGQRVTTLVDGHRPAGAHTAVWDATDAAGQAVGAGVYFYRLSGGGATWTRKMVLLDGQAGTAAAGAGWTAAARPMEEDPPVYGLTVSGEGLVPYVDPAFRVEAGMTPVEVEVAAPARAKRLQREDGLLGDVDGNGRVDVVDALFVTMYSVDASRLAATIPHIALGDVNGDGLIDFVDAYLIGTYSVNPADPVLPAGIGERVTVSSTPPPSADDHSDTRSGATLLFALGGSSVGQITTRDDVDYFTVHVSEPGFLTVYTTGIPDTNGRLENDSGSPLETGRNNVSGRNFRIENHSVSAGTYYVRVSAQDSRTEDYTIHASFVRDAHSDTRSGATPLALGGGSVGQITTRDDVDYFTVHVSEPGFLAVYTTGSLDTEGRLENDSGSPLETDRDSGRGSNFRIGNRSVSAGTYYVKVEGQGRSTGDYTIHASFARGG